MNAVKRLLPLLALAGCDGCTERATAPRTVLVLVLDGVRTDEFTSSTPSNLTGLPGELYASGTWSALVPEGTVVRAALNTGVTVTAPAHAALLTGREETYANFPVDPDRGPALYRPELPTIFEEARDQLGLREDEVVLLANTDLLAGVNESLYPGLSGGARYSPVLDGTAAARDDDPVFEDLVALLEGDPRLVVVNLHDADRGGHFGDEDDYVDNVAKLDVLLPAFWSTLQRERPDLVENLLLVVTADHGRHRDDVVESWRSHGDSCVGCREVPLLLIGGGARVGDERADAVTTIDLAPTVAAWLGVELPWADGMAYVEAFDGLVADVRSGAVSLAVAGEHEATQVWRDDRNARSDVLVDGQIVSTPGTFAAEAPALVETADGLRVCFRELDIATGEHELPWRPRCLAEADGAWSDMGFPDDEAGTAFRVAFADRDGTLWAAWPHNPDGGADEGIDGDVAVHLAAWNADSGWTEPLVAEGLFPTDAALVPTARGLVAAVGATLGEPDWRYDRRIRIQPVDLTGETPTLDAFVDLTFEALLGDDGRPERPALAADGDTVRVAALGHMASGQTLVVATTSADGGLTWGEPVALPDAGPPFPHLAPQWDGAALVWAVAPEDRDGEALLCRATPDDLEAACVGVGSPRVQSFAARDGVATVIRDAGSGAWERAVVPW